MNYKIEGRLRLMEKTLEELREDADYIARILKEEEDEVELENFRSMAVNWSACSALTDRLDQLLQLSFVAQEHNEIQQGAH